MGRASKRRGVPDDADQQPTSTSTPLQLNSPPDVYKHYLDSYASHIQLLHKPDLAQLDTWYYHELPDRIHARTPPHCTAAELVDIVRWKLARGKWRPALLGYAKAQTDTAVVAATSAAFTALAGSDTTPPTGATVSTALSHLTTLKGVGVATASALLAAYDTSVAFMSDDAIMAVVPSRAYTLPVYLQVLEVLRAQAVRLGGAHSDGGHVWSVRDVERALWCSGAHVRLGVGGSTGGATKHKTTPGRNTTRKSTTTPQKKRKKT